MRWSELDLSRPFQMFYREIKYKMDNYALIIHNQQFIFETILKHLDLSHLNNVGKVPSLARNLFSYRHYTDILKGYCYEEPIKDG